MQEATGRDVTGAASGKKFNTAKKKNQVRFPIGYNFISRNTMGKAEIRTVERYLHTHFHTLNNQRVAINQVDTNKGTQV